MEELTDGAERQLIGTELPEGLERRLVLRLLSHWRELCGEREFPSYAQIDPARIPDLWPYCFVLEIAGHTDNPVFRNIGASLTEQAGLNLTDKPVSDVPEKSLIAAAVTHVDEVLRSKVPVSRGDAYFRPDGLRVNSRSILLPISDNGKTINYLLGATNSGDINEEKGA